MAAIEAQIIRAESSAGDTVANVVAEGAAAGVRPLLDNGSASSRVQGQLELARQRQLLDPCYRIHSHRPLIGPLFDLLKRLIHWGARPYADAIRQRQELFNEAALQALRELSLQIDALERHHMETHREIAAHGEHLRAAVEAIDRRFNLLEARAAATVVGVNRLRARHDLGPFYEQVAPENRLAALDASRGAYDDIAARQAHYVALFRAAPGPVLDVGCGRGELLAQLRRAGIECRGVDADPLMVEMTRQAGVPTERMEAIEALRAVAPATLGGIFAAQVVEHFFPGELLEFLMLARRTLAPGGRIVLETLNPTSLGVMAKSYWRDIDHKQAIHPEALRSLVELAGFDAAQVHTITPFEPGDRLPDLPPAPQAGLAPEAHALLQDRLDRLNAILYGNQDYYVEAVQGIPAEGARP